MKLSNNKILITGGATGIGLGLAERFIKEGNTVLICGRREEALKKAKDMLPSLITKVCDLGEEESRVSLYKWVSDNHPDLNVLINNAGIQNWMNISDDDFYEKANGEIAINVAAPLHLTNLFLGLKSLDTIMNVTSGLAFIPLAKVPVYCATKAFLRSFTLSLRYSLKEKGIGVVEIIPPALNTDLGAPGLHTAFPPVSEFIETIFEQLRQGRQELAFSTSETRLKVNNEEIMGYFNRMNP